MSKKLYLELDNETKRMAAAAAAIKGVPIYTYVAQLIVADCLENGIAGFIKQDENSPQPKVRNDHE